MTTDPAQPSTDTLARQKPSRAWYLLALVLLLGSSAVFGLAVRGKMAYVNDQLAGMQRFVGPTGEQGVVVTIDEPGKQNIFYENLGTLDGKAYDTPRRQVWTTYEAPSMSCVVTRVDTGESIGVRLPGVGIEQKKTEATEDLIPSYNTSGMQGHGAWVFKADTPGAYRIVLRYVEAVALDPDQITIRDELTAADKRRMTQTEGEEYEAERRAEIERASLALLEPVDVLFAVGPDPTGGSLFAVLGLKGAATVLAFGFTSSVLIALVTLMLRGGHVTPRGELADARRLMGR